MVSLVGNFNGKLLRLIMDYSSWENPFSSIMVKIDGPFAKKKSLNAKQAIENARNMLKREVEFFRWKLNSRASYSVEFMFFTTKMQSPTLQNLVKFYLDTMKGIIFLDDRQVKHLVASCYRTNSRNTVAEEEYLYIKVCRMSDYNKKIWLCDKLLGSELLRGRIDLNDDKYDAFSEVSPSLEDLDLWDEEVCKTLGFSKEAIERIIHLDTLQYQETCLRQFKIDPFDKPGYPRERNIRRPCYIHLGQLPSQSKYEEYKKAIEDSLANDTHTMPFKLNKLIDPIDIEIRVSSTGKTLHKDLDNIALDIIPIFSKLYLSKQSYVESYRIFFVGCENDNSLSLKPLRRGSIVDFFRAVDEIIEEGEFRVGY
jgi:Holliday junction resolvase RusA-like endonuclease